MELLPVLSDTPAGEESHCRTEYFWGGVLKITFCRCRTVTTPPDFWQMGILVLEGLLRWERLNGNNTLKQYSNWEVTGLVNVIVLQCWMFCLNSFFSLSEKEPSFLLQRTSGRRHRCWRYCRSEGRFSAYSIWFDIKSPQLFAWPWQGVQISKNMWVMEFPMGMSPIVSLNHVFQPRKVLMLFPGLWQSHRLSKSVFKATVGKEYNWCNKGSIKYLSALKKH